MNDTERLAAVEQRIAQLEGRIEQLTAQLAAMAARAPVVGPPYPSTVPGWNPGQITCGTSSDTATETTA